MHGIRSEYNDNAIDLSMHTDKQAVVHRISKIYSKYEDRNT